MTAAPSRPARRRMLRFGITGGIGSGKSAVAARIAERGFPVVDADACARDAVRPGTPGHAAVVALLGPAAVREDGTLDRAAIARLVFADPGLRRRLEAILHPAVGALVADWFDRQERDGGSAAFYHAPLLFEAGHDRGLDGVIVLTCDEEIRVRRAAARDGTGAAEVRARIRAQASDAERCARGTHVIANDGSLEDLRRAVDDLLDRLLAGG